MVGGCAVNPPPASEAQVPAPVADAPVQPAAQPAPAPLAYPDTKRVDVIETQFGVPVADPYRWLENDVRNDPDVAAWVAAENQVTD